LRPEKVVYHQYHWGQTR